MNALNTSVGVKHQGGDSVGDPGPGFVEPSRDPNSDGQGVPDTFPKPDTVRKGLCAGVVCLGLIMGIGLPLWREQVPSPEHARVERDIYPISSKAEGTIGKIFVSNGQMVKPGDLLVEMDRRELEAKWASTSAAIIQGQATLQAIAERLTKTQPELERTALMMGHRERELDAKLLDDEALLGSSHKKGASPGQSRTVRTAYQAALSRYLEQKVTLEGVIDRVQRDQDLRKATAATLRIAEATLAWTNRQLADTRIYAAVTGRVAFDKSKVAQHLQAGEVFLSLLGEPWVAAHFDAYQLKRCKLGQQVWIRIGAIQGRTFRGKIERIAPLVRGGGDRVPARTLAVALFQPLETTPVTIRFDADSVLGFEERMDPGLPSSVEVIPSSLKVET